VAIVRLRLVRALVVDVENSITIVIRIRTPIIILKSVDVLRVHWAGIVPIDNAIPVVILIWAAVIVFERIEVLGLIGAPIQIIGKAVAISIPVAARARVGRSRGNDERGLRRRIRRRPVLVGDHQRGGCRF
jgi:hypothetical protein